MLLQKFSALGCEKLVAANPAEPRDSSRLLVLDRKTGALEHRVFRDLTDYLKKGDCVVVNDTKVFPAKLNGKKATGGKFELLLVRQEDQPHRWSALCRECQEGLTVVFAGGVTAAAEGKNAAGEWIFVFSTPHVLALAERSGSMPLPHYIEKARRLSGQTAQNEGDKNRYQTVFARENGSIAAPTAGFHFTPELIGKLKAGGVIFAPVTLHVGWGTFRPVHKNGPEHHKMLPEYAQVSAETARTINAARKAGGRVIPVGTTCTRTLESFAAPDGAVESGGKWADIFIYPPYRFRAADAIITNFHIPSSTPLFMAAAFAGGENLYRAYEEAVRLQYRFYSYGDAMLLL